MRRPKLDKRRRFQVRKHDLNDRHADGPMTDLHSVIFFETLSICKTRTLARTHFQKQRTNKRKTKEDFIILLLLSSIVFAGLPTILLTIDYNTNQNYAFDTISDSDEYKTSLKFDVIGFHRRYKKLIIKFGKGH
ncbi:hypothetical protein GQX74_007546 [Glossina fuscipes]|nr:hypothetical protein GQX74_007546 [Glossina fuscipes]